jgi:hypothetical protein
MGKFTGLRFSKGAPMPAPSQEIDAMIAAFPGWRGEVLAKLRRIIHDTDPEITEQVKWKRPGNPAGVPVFEHKGIVCIVGVLKTSVRITFGAGSILPDPHKMFNAMLKGKSRAIDFHEGDRIDDAAVKAIIRSAVKINLSRVDAAKTRKTSSK